VPQQLGLAFAACAHAQKTLLGAAARRKNVVAADEHVDFADTQVPAHHLHDLQHGEQPIAILLDLGPLVAVKRILNRQVWQVEFLVHRAEFLARGLEQRDPDETFRFADVTVDFAGLDVGEFLATLVRNTID
jgi:hypothetical protein